MTLQEIQLAEIELDIIDRRDYDLWHARMTAELDEYRLPKKEKNTTR